MKLLVLIVRGLQAAAGGPFGNRWIETFTLDALAAQGVVFHTHLAAHPEPERARRVWRSGCHDFPPLPGDEAPPVERPDLLALLRRHGVATRLILDTSRPTADAWAAGWDDVRREADTATALVAAHEALDELADVPSWLLWVELAALLPPWELPEEIVEPYFAPPSLEEKGEEEDDEQEGLDYLAEEELLEPLFDPPLGPIEINDDRLYLRIQKTCGAAVAYVDAMLGEVLDGLADDIHVLLTADHGQALGEHGHVGPDRASLYQEVVHVPLLLVGPGCRPGQHVAAVTASIDLAPTIAALAGATLDGAQGRSLLPLLGVEDPPWRDHVALGAQVGDAVVLGSWSADWAIHVPASGDAGAVSLYVKPDDRWEVNDVAKQHAEWIDKVAEALRVEVRAARQPGPLQAPPLPALDEEDEASDEPT